MTTFKPEALIRILIIGSIITDVLLLTLISIYHSLYNNMHTYTFLALGTIVLVYFSLCALAIKVHRITVSAKLVIAFYYIVAVATSLTVGIASSISLLLYCFFILVGGVLLGSGYVVKTATWSVVTLFVLQILSQIAPSLFPQADSSLTMIAAYSILYSIFALVGWLAASQIERALHESLQAKTEIVRQKNLLSQALESEEYRRKRFQIEELNKLHKFAELGQQTTLLLHDFANQLTNLSLEIDDTSPSSRRQAQVTLKEINTTMQTVREKLTVDEYSAINVQHILTACIKERGAKLRAVHIRLHYKSFTQHYPPIACGDNLKLRQVFNILIDNAIQSYEHVDTKGAKRITITVSSTEDEVTIRLTDYGIGISVDQRKKIFHSHSTTKVGGHGIGLYIAKRVIEHQFNGSLTLDHDLTCTTFVITLPRIT